MDVEKRIEFIRDSVDYSIDDNICKKMFFSNLNSPVGLYILCQYANRFCSIKQRTKLQPEEIEILLNK